MDNIQTLFPVGQTIIVTSKCGMHYKRIGKIVGYTKNNHYLRIYFQSTNITTNYSRNSVRLIKTA